MLEQLKVDLGTRSYPIFIGESLLCTDQRIEQYITTTKVVIISNQVVAPLYLSSLTELLKDKHLLPMLLTDGEQYKNLASFELIMSFMLENNVGRDTTIIALGGGVVGDIAGFSAACYQRGIPFIQIPTTLLSQVDSSVGGKTAVNHPLGKNMVGAFYQPQAVFIDICTLKTLPSREFSAGMAEVIKYGVVYDAEFFTWLENQQQEIIEQRPQTLTRMIKRCCQIKAEIVSADEREAGVRALLNLGHTFGHAIEAEMGYGNWLHGEAVAVGIVMACRLAADKGWMSSQSLTRVINLLQGFGLPVQPPETMGYAAFMQHMQRDKKVAKGQIRFVVPTELGAAIVTKDVSTDELHRLIG